MVFTRCLLAEKILTELKNPRQTQSDEQVLEPTLGPDTPLPTTLPTPEFHPLVNFFNRSGSDEPSQLCQELVRLKFAKILFEKSEIETILWINENIGHRKTSSWFIRMVVTAVIECHLSDGFDCRYHYHRSSVERQPKVYAKLMFKIILQL